MVIVMKLEVAFRIPAAGIALRGDSVRTRTWGPRRVWIESGKM